MTQPARQLPWTLPDEQKPIRFLTRDRAMKFTAACNGVFAAAGIRTIKTPDRSLKANTDAERWIRSARAAVLDRDLILNEGHRRRVLKE